MKPFDCKSKQAATLIGKQLVFYNSNEHFDAESMYLIRKKDEKQLD